MSHKNNLSGEGRGGEGKGLFIALEIAK